MPQDGFPAFYFSTCQLPNSELRYDTTEGGIGLEKDSALYQLMDTRMHSPPFRAEKSPSAFDRCVGICYNKSTKGILPIDGQPKLKTLTRM